MFLSRCNGGSRENTDPQFSKEWQRGSSRTRSLEIFIEFLLKSGNECLKEDLGWNSLSSAKSHWKWLEKQDSSLPFCSLFWWLKQKGIRFLVALILHSFPFYHTVYMYFISDVSLRWWIHTEVGEGFKLSHPQPGKHHGDNKDLQEEAPEGLKTESKGPIQRGLIWL